MFILIFIIFRNPVSVVNTAVKIKEHNKRRHFTVCVCVCIKLDILILLQFVFE